MGKPAFFLTAWFSLGRQSRLSQLEIELNVADVKLLVWVYRILV